MTSPAPPHRLVIVVGAVLMAATLSSAWLGHGLGPRRVATVAVIVVAFAKVLLVGEYFMELRRAPLPFRLVFGGWTALMAAVLIGLYLHSG